MVCPRVLCFEKGCRPTRRMCFVPGLRVSPPFFLAALSVRSSGIARAVLALWLLAGAGSYDTGHDPAASPRQRPPSDASRRPLMHATSSRHALRPDDRRSPMDTGSPHAVRRGIGHLSDPKGTAHLRSEEPGSSPPARLLVAFCARHEGPRAGHRFCAAEYSSGSGLHRRATERFQMTR